MIVLNVCDVNVDVYGDAKTNISILMDNFIFYSIVGFGTQGKQFHNWGRGAGKCSGGSLNDPNLIYLDLVDEC